MKCLGTAGSQTSFSAVLSLSGSRYVSSTTVGISRMTDGHSVSHWVPSGRAQFTVGLHGPEWSASWQHGHCRASWSRAHGQGAWGRGRLLNVHFRSVMYRHQDPKHSPSTTKTGSQSKELCCFSLASSNNATEQPILSRNCLTRNHQLMDKLPGPSQGRHPSTVRPHAPSGGWALPGHFLGMDSTPSWEHQSHG